MPEKYDNTKNTADIPTKKIIKGSFKLLIKIILTVGIVLILLTAFLKLIKFEDTADSETSENLKKWQSVDK